MLLDGVRVDVLQHLLGSGDLPNMARLMVEPGGQVTGTTVFPSTTGVAYIPFLFGRYPGPAGVPGIRWLDRAGVDGGVRSRWRAARSYCSVQAGWLNRDIGDGPSIFDLCPESLAICTPIDRGLGKGRKLIPFRRAVLGPIAHYAGTWQSLDNAVCNAWVASASRRDWRFKFVVFPGLDGNTHLHDPWHPSVLEGYRVIDRALGRYNTIVERHRPRPHYIAAADHGATVIREHCELALQLEAWGLRTIRHPFHVWRSHAQAAVMVSGNASAQVYLPSLSGPRPLDSDTVPRDLLERLVALPAVRIAAFRDADGGIRVVSKDGETRIHETEDGIQCEPLRGDALGIGAIGPGTPDRTVLNASRATELPDSPRQLLQLFATDRAGDIALAARSGSDFRGKWEIPEHRSGHGSLVAEHMEVPILSSVPFPDRTALRTVDLMPTMLELLGIDSPDGIDGLPISALDDPTAVTLSEPDRSLSPIPTADPL
jgi:Type I phosphodiesterase / nucleotide pyrophosphatase